MNTVYAYIRVSTAKQGEGVSLEVQEKAIKEYAKKHELHIAQWFIEKKTAAKQGRPLFLDMIRQLKARKAHGIIIHKIDRSARNLKDWSELGSLIDQGVQIHFVHESLDLQQRGGRLSADIQAIIAADYVRNLRQEAIKGLYGRLEQGIYPFNAPIGYENNGKGKHKTIHTFQGPLVRKAFELYATKKYSMEELEEIMHGFGLRNSVNRRVKPNGIGLILNNPFYMGVIKIKGQTYRGGHEPLITSTLYNKVQNIIRGNDNQKVRKHDLKFKKCLTCKGCNYSLIGEIQKGKVYYRCHTKDCITKGIRETVVEALLEKAIAMIKLHPSEEQEVHRLIEELHMDWMGQQEKALSALQFQKAQLNQKIQRLTDCYVEQGLSREEYCLRKEQLLIESRANDEQERAVSDSKMKMFEKAQKFLELSKSLTEQYKNANLSFQRRLLEIFTSNLYVEEKKLVVSMRSPFLEIANRHILSSGAPIRGANRTKYSKPGSVLVYSEPNTSPIISPPLSSEALRSLAHEILDVCATLPDLDLSGEES